MLGSKIRSIFLHASKGLLCLCVILVIDADACNFGSHPRCLYPCRCADPDEVCDQASGHCLSGCQETLPKVAGLDVGWRGPGCVVGNVAYGKQASQISTGVGIGELYEADRAVDGDVGPQETDGHCAWPGTLGGPRAWWMLDLGTLHRITAITVFNSNSTGASNLLQQFSVFISNSSTTAGHGDHDRCANFSSQVPQGGHTTRACTAPLLGRYVLLVREAGPELYHTHLCEIVVEGNVYNDCAGTCDGTCTTDYGFIRCPPGTDPQKLCQGDVSFNPDSYVAVDEPIDASAIVRWAAVDEVQGPEFGQFVYVVQYKKASANLPWTSQKTAAHQAGQSTYEARVDALAYNTSYAFRIVPYSILVGLKIWGEATIQVQAKTGDLYFQPDSYVVVDNATSTSVTVRWSAAEGLDEHSADHYHYVVQHKPVSSNLPWENSSTVQHQAGVSTHESKVEVLTYNTAYVFRVVPFRNNVAGGESKHVQIKTRCTDPSEVAVERVITYFHGSDSTVQALFITWEDPDVSGCDTLNRTVVAYRSSRSDPWVEQTELDPTTHRHTFQPSSAGNYTVEIKVYNNDELYSVKEDHTYAEGRSLGLFASLFAGIAGGLSIFLLVVAVILLIHRRRVLAQQSDAPAESVPTDNNGVASAVAASNRNTSVVPDACQRPVYQSIDYQDMDARPEPAERPLTTTPTLAADITANQNDPESAAAAAINRNGRDGSRDATANGGAMESEYVLPECPPNVDIPSMYLTMPTNPAADTAVISTSTIPINIPVSYEDDDDTYSISTN